MNATHFWDVTRHRTACHAVNGATSADWQKVDCEACRDFAGVPENVGSAIAKALAAVDRTPEFEEEPEYLVELTKPSERSEAEDEGRAGPGGKEECMAKEQNGASGEQLEIKVPVDKSILEHRRNRLIEVEQKIDKVKAKKREVSSEYSLKLKELGEERSELLDQIETGFQKLTVAVYERPDQRLHRMLKVRTDTGEVVGERALTANESQVTLDEVLASKAAGEQVAAKAETKANGAAKPPKPKGKRKSKKGSTRAVAEA